MARKVDDSVRYRSTIERERDSNPPKEGEVSFTSVPRPIWFIGDDELVEQLPLRLQQLDDLRAMVETAAPHHRRPAAPQRIAAEAIVARYDHPEPAWHACVDAGLIPASWEHRVPNEVYWMGYSFEFSIRSGPVASALESIGAADVCSRLYGSGRTTRSSIDSAAIASLLWRAPDTRLVRPRSYLRDILKPPIDRYDRAVTATLPDPFAAMLALLRTGYGFEFQGPPEDLDHVLFIPQDARESRSPFRLPTRFDMWRSGWPKPLASGVTPVMAKPHFK